MNVFGFPVSIFRKRVHYFGMAVPERSVLRLANSTLAELQFAWILTIKIAVPICAGVASTGSRGKAVPLSPSGIRPAMDHDGSQRYQALLVGHNGDGGSAYELMVAEALADKFDLSRYTLDFRKWGVLKYVTAPLEFSAMLRVLKNSPNYAVAVKTFTAALLNPRRQPPSIVIVHHLGASPHLIYSVAEKYILQQIPKAKAVVVVSEYWKRYLLQRGLTNVYTIYNAFKVQEFGFTTQEIESFKRRYDLVGKPIIYVGNYAADKGTKESSEALKDLDVHLVASGRAGQGRSRMKCLFLERRDYLCLLAASTVAITMSQFTEGWCRTAHEAMLCGTPVIGSGQGGMGELLESGGQTICRDFRSLKGLVEGLLANEEKREELGRKGREFARQFTVERFQAEWVDLVTKICTAPLELLQ
jgi:glycosyltransferase involved in cell wall biosynthesis